MNITTSFKPVIIIIYKTQYGLCCIRIFPYACFTKQFFDEFNKILVTFND